MDITSAFDQRMVYPDDNYRTGISTHRGHEKLYVAPMSFKRPVEYMQKFMGKLFQGLGWRFSSCCVGDIVVYSKSFSEHVLHLDEVFKILSDAGLIRKAQKTFLFFIQLNY
jgi:hypothetical protein